VDPGEAELEPSTMALQAVVWFMGPLSQQSELVRVVGLEKPVVEQNGPTGVGRGEGVQREPWSTPMPRIILSCACRSSMKGLRQSTTGAYCVCHGVSRFQMLR